MSTNMYDKRKNDQPRRRYPQWVVLAMLLVGLLIGSIVTTVLLTTPVETGQPIQYSEIEMNEFALTATQIVNEATAMAVATQAVDIVAVDEFTITTPYIIDMATATAQAANP